MRLGAAFLFGVLVAWATRFDPAAGCLCAADFLSCSGSDLDRIPAALPASTVTLDLSHNRIASLEPGAFEALPLLETLRLGRNLLTELRPGVFANASGAVRHLDLSSNRLRALEEHYFLDLPALETLLLFDNRIERVESRALGGFLAIRRVYLSHNRLTDFPFFTVRNHHNLSVLDLSSNRLAKLPLDDVSALSLSLQAGLYLHNNSLVCDCPLYALLRLWERRGFASALAFRRLHLCRLYGLRRATLAFLLHARYFDRCRLPWLPRQEGSVAVRAGSSLLLHCLASRRDASFFWVAPDREYVAPPGNNGSLRMFANGSLEIARARESDAGVYLCVAADGERNDTWEVNVTVLTAATAFDHDALNTGFTTLMGCVVTLAVVLAYLYLTPCRCPPWSAAASPATPAQASILAATPPDDDGLARKVSSNKRVAFLEPVAENGGPRAGGVTLH